MGDKAQIQQSLNQIKRKISHLIARRPLLLPKSLRLASYYKITQCYKGANQWPA
jgi:hypothetical protein